MMRALPSVFVAWTILQGASAPCAFAQSDDAVEETDEDEAASPLESDEGAAPSTQVEPDFALEVAAGAGMGARSVRLPTGMGERSIDLGWFPALELGVTGALHASSWFVFELGARYRTSVGLTATETSSTSHDLSTSVRTNEVSFGVTPRFQFAEGPDAVHAGLFVGYGFRGFRPVIELRVPAYSLSGPLARAELGIPLLRGAVEIRIAPEAQWLAFVSRALQVAGATAPTGLAFGGEASLVVQPTQALSLQLVYREMRARVASHWDGDLQEVVRLASLGAALHY
jgi:hypothetical protein